MCIAKYFLAGIQKVPEEGKEALEGGVSITNACVGLDDTTSVLDVMSEAVAKRKKIVRSNRYTNGAATDAPNGH